MTAKTKYIIKLIFVLILILASPAVFFGSIGGNSLQVNKNMPGKIAVVNEDIGTEKESKELDFGKELSSILQKDSKFEWTVMSRSAAENGLKGIKYDAVVYIPSNFSKDIMSYEEQQPVKARLEYKVQDQLDVMKREKVLGEIERATNRVNDDISTLYWSYVSQDLENVKKKFDKIVEKEMDFQKAMLAFYKPSSKSLSGEIEQQQNMLKGIQSMTSSEAKATPERKDLVKQVETELSGFLSFVDMYQQYQDNQKELLLSLQSESNEELSLFNEDMSTNLNDLWEHMESNNENFQNLNQTYLYRLDKQRKDLISYFKDQDSEKIQKLGRDITALKNQLVNGIGQDHNPIEIPGDLPTANTLSKNEAGTTETPPSSEKNLSIKEERNELQNIAKEMEQIKSSLESIADPKPEQVVSAVNSLPLLTNRLSEVEKKLAEIEVQENPLQKTVDELKALNEDLWTKNKDLITQYNKLVEDNKSLLKQFSSSSDSLQTIIDEVEKKETDILQVKGLSESEKSELIQSFDKPIAYRLPITVLKYYSTLVDYELAVKSKLDGNPENTDAMNKKVNEILGVSEEEEKLWKELSETVPMARTKVSTVQDQFVSFMEEYTKKIEQQQTVVASDLASLEESSGNALETTQLYSSSSLMSNQMGIGQEILMMDSALDSLSESQENIVSYTNGLLTKVQDVQQDADKLNGKWAANVSTTQKFRDDIFNVLGNAYVDGQKNGPVYNHLSNPLQISGNVTPSDEENKSLSPVVILMIILISSLLIGYFTNYFKNAPRLVYISMFILLNLVVGLIVSLFGLNIYSLGERPSIEWSLFTILLLTASSTYVLTGFLLGRLVGWIGTVSILIFYMIPMLVLAVPEIDYEDPMSKVYMSILHGTDSLIMPATLILLGVIAILIVIPNVIKMMMKRTPISTEEEQVYEA